MALGGQFAVVVHARDEIRPVLLAAGRHHRLQLVVRLLEPAQRLVVPAYGDVLGVGVRVGREGAGEHLEPGDEPVAVGHVLEQRAEAVDEGFLVLGVPQSHARALDLDGGGDGTAVRVQEYGDLVGAERGGEPGDPADSGRRPDLDLAPVDPGAGLHRRRAVDGAGAQGALEAAVDLEPLVERAALVRHVDRGQRQHGEAHQQHDAQGQDGDEEPAHHAEERAADDQRDLAGLTIPADDRVRPGAADQICTAGRDRMGHVGLGRQRPSPPVRLVLLLRVLLAWGVFTGLPDRGTGAAEGTDPPPPFAVRELCAATPPAAWLAGRGVLAL